MRWGPFLGFAVLAALGAGSPGAALAVPATDPCVVAGGTPFATGIARQLTCQFTTPNSAATPSYSFTVPAGATSVTVIANGAQGGATANAAGGHSAQAVGTFSGLGGTALSVVVAGAGQRSGQGGYPGGGAGGSRTGESGGGGGGASSVTGSSLLVMAGGGGGGGDTVAVGGYPVGGAGADASQSAGGGGAGTKLGGCCAQANGGGGGQNGAGTAAGGLGGFEINCPTYSSTNAGGDGTSSTGGAGGSAASTAGSGGGGGAGYVGGGGGGSGTDCYYSQSLTFSSGGGGGGGGSSYVAPSATGASITGGHSGSGSVVIVYTLPPSPNLVQGGFESPKFTVDGRELFAPARYGAWSITQGSVDVVNSSYWPAAAGTHSIDLAGSGPGTITQTVTLPYADSYRIGFKLSGNPDCATPVVKKIGIYWNGALVATRTFNIAVVGNSRTAMGWSQRSVDVNGLPGTATIGFASLSTGPCGPVLDAVVLRYQ